MNMIHNMIPITPLTKETLKKFKDDKSVQERMQIIKGCVQKIYDEVIKTAINGNTNYTVLLSSLFDYQRYLHDKHIIELITELYLVFPDSTIQFTEKYLYDDIQDNKTVVECIVIDWL